MDERKQEVIDKVTALVASRFGGDPKAAFDHYDSDHDDRIDHDELVAMLSDAGIGNRVTRGAWARGVIDALDADGDGRISRAELRQAVGR